MKIISASGKVESFKKIFLAIGVFDGVHRGHQCLIKRVVARANHEGAMSVVMTFDPHPVNVLHPEIYCPLLISLKHRLKLIEDLGVDVCMVIHFTKIFSQLSPEQFIQDFLIKKIYPEEVFIGDDFRFGQNRSGDLNFFQAAAHRHGFKVNIVSAVKEKSEVISSTRIRKLIAAGDIRAASRLLGRLVSVLGTVIKGESRGKSLGFPTANIDPDCDFLPPCGVYLVYVEVHNQRLKGIANIGVRPSFNHQKKNDKVVLEVYILDFRENIYGQKIIIEFIKKNRDEIKFPSQEDLIDQIKTDERKARKYFHLVKFPTITKRSSRILSSFSK